MKIASLDLGSNSFLCLLCEADENGIFKIHKDMVEIVRLGQDINKTKRIQPEALVRAKNCLTKFKAEIDIFKPEKILAYGTSAARDAENNQEFFKIGKDLGIPIDIISGKKEALATYRGVFWGKPNNSIQSKNLLIDIGGGSTEIILGQGLNLIDSMSLNMGAVRMTEKWISKYPVSEAEAQALKTDIVLNLSNNLDKIKQNKPDLVYAVAGTPTTLAAAEMGGKFDPDKVEGFIFSIADLSLWEAKLASSSVEEIINLHKIPSGRADIIYSGIVILKTILETVGADKVVVSTRGVRFGIVADHFTK